MKKLLISFTLLLIIASIVTSQSFASSNTYTVKKGDSLWTIAKKYHTSINNLKKWNHLKSDTIHIKQKLKVSNTTTTKKATKKKTVKKASTKKASKTKSFYVSASAYTGNCKGCSGVTYTGYNLKKHPNAKIISVDPKVIPLGSKVYVPGYGTAIAADKGSGIKGKTIDVFISSQKKAINWGRKKIKIQIIK